MKLTEAVTVGEAFNSTSPLTVSTVAPFLVNDVVLVGQRGDASWGVITALSSGGGTITLGWHVEPDGTHFAFTSSATLTADTPNDGTGAWQVFVADLAGNTTLLSAPLAGGYNGDSEFAGWSPDGGTALISSASDLTANDTDNGVGTDLFAVDIGTGTKTLLTQSVPGGVEGGLVRGHVTPTLPEEA